MRALLLIVPLFLYGCADEPAPGTQAPPSAGASGGAASGSTSASASSSAGAPDASAHERWGGRIAVPGQAALEFEVRFAPGDPPRAKMAIPAQGLAPTDLEDVTRSAEAMTFTLALPGTPASAHARFAIVRTAGQPIATGTMKQHGLTLSVQMRPLAAEEKVGDGSRPQAPRPPLPYAQRDASYASRDGTRLAGTLTVPTGGTKHAALLLITGTGAQDRDETLAGHKPFLVIADHLTRAGIAVLRVDDRGVGGSGGDTAQADLARKAEDARAGLVWLAQQPEIDAHRIGIVGHSEGGLIGPIVAGAGASAHEPAVAFLVLLAAPGVPGRVLAKKQQALMLRAQGVPQARFDVAMDGQNKVVDALASGASDETLRAIIVAHTDATLRLLNQDERERLGEPGRRAMIDGSFAAVANPAMRSFIRSDPAPALEKVRCPVLALGGTLDLQVPADENLAAIRAALERGKNADVTIEALAGLNHLLQPAAVGTMEEWATIDTTIDPAVLDRLASWLRERAGLPAGG